MKATTSKQRTPGAWRLDALVWALRRARWGDLAGRENHGVRAVLVALVELARRHRALLSGRIETTEWQLAGHTGYSTRWVRRCLQLLEYAGVLRWWRGGIAYGRPTPSLFVLSRRTLGALTAAARRTATTAELAHRADTIERLSKLRSGFVKSPSPRYRRSDHAALSANLHPDGGRPQDDTPRSHPTLQQSIDAADVATARQQLKGAPTAPGRDYMGSIRADIAAARMAWRP